MQKGNNFDHISKFYRFFTQICSSLISGEITCDIYTHQGLRCVIMDPSWQIKTVTVVNENSMQGYILSKPRL